ncbi:MAG: GNAT family N-acetyltransferase [Planctomycetales bacterium]|nr:GNAT family N-acetyltransferase [Planctomycetales bacterium]
MNIVIRPLQPGDAESLVRLRRQALVEEPFAFLSSPEDDRASSPGDVREQLAASPHQSAVLGALDGSEAIGMVGLNRDRPIKAAHRACIWGVFVKPEYRGQGIGSQLLQATLDFARGMDGVETVYLGVSEKTPDAKRLYEAAGFSVWGLEPDCMRYEGVSAREYHLSRTL